MTKNDIENYCRQVFDMVHEALGDSATLHGNEITIRFTGKDIVLEGYVTATFTIIGGRANTRMAFHDDVGNKAKTVSARGLSIINAASFITLYAGNREAEVATRLRLLGEFRNLLYNELTSLGLDRDCDSKSISSYVSRKLNVMLTYRDGRFYAQISPGRYSRNRKVYKYDGKACPELVPSLMKAIRMAIG